MTQCLYRKLIEIEAGATTRLEEKVAKEEIYQKDLIIAEYNCKIYRQLKKGHQFHLLAIPNLTQTEVC